VRSHSDDEFEEDEDDDDDATGISRSHLRVDEARSLFLPAKVDAGDVDFSDRVDGKRKSYKASTRRQRILQDGTRELGDLSDDDDAEGLERKIARLKREVEEAKAEYSNLVATSQGQKEQVPDGVAKLATLSQVLEEISRPSVVVNTGVLRTPLNDPERPVPAKSSAGGNPAVLDEATYTVTYAPTYEQTHALAKAADFDRRLQLLEKAIGIGSSALPEVDINGIPRAILPTLDTLQKQILTLSQASTSNLDSITRRVRTLTQEAEQLEKARVNAKAAQEALSSSGVVDSGDATEQTAKINALYGMLPTIENLTPLLPPLLDRLRSLRAIHMDAAISSETLSKIEKQQIEMASDLKQWRDGLEKVEEAIKQGGTTMEGNMKVMDTWVKDLEARMAKLG
jgi:nuclear migration protein JNM1